MLRCWCEETGPDGPAHWRFALEDLLQPHTVHGFATLCALIEFLEAELGDAGSEGA